MLDTIKAPFLWVAEKWDQFEDWFASKIPWLKSKMIALLGFISTGALSLQELVTNIPLSQIMTAERVAISSTVLFAIIWFVRRLGTK